MRRDCGEREPGWWSWCSHRGGHGPREHVRLTPAWMRGIVIERLEGTVCDKHGSLCAVGSAECRAAQEKHDRKVASDAAAEAIRAHHQGAAPSRFDRATGKGKTFLAWVGGIFALFALEAGVVGAAVHVMVIVLCVVAGSAAAGGAAGFVFWRVRSVSRNPLPPPDYTPQVREAIRQGILQPPRAARRALVTGDSRRRLGENAESPGATARTPHGKPPREG